MSTCKVVVSTVGQKPVLGQLRKTPAEENLSSQIQLIPLIAALILSLASDFLIQICVWFPEEKAHNLYFHVHVKTFIVQKKFKKNQNLRAKPLIFNGLKISCLVASHKLSELMF